MSSADKPDKGPQKEGQAKGANARSGSDSDAPAWAQGLKQLYDSVVEEPLPDSLKDLLDAFDEGTGPGGDAGTGKTS